MPAAVLPSTIAELKAQFMAWKGHPLSKEANPVFGNGNPHADIVFIGEAPGQREDEQGVPFVGQAGKLLDELLGTIGLQRADVYITNVVKYRPPGNRDPLPEEKELCLPWLKAELALIKPTVLVPLGRHALTQFFAKANISKVHGEPQKLTDDTHVFPLFHPAAALHNPALRDTLFTDIKKLKDFLDAHKAARRA